MTRVFISYAREDLESAVELYDALETSGFVPWLDKKTLRPGQRWEPAIKKAISDSHYFIALLSNRSVSKKGYVQKELRLAMDVLDTIPEDEIFIIPARLEECEPTHERLRELNWVDLYPDSKVGISAIVRVIGFTPAELFQTSLVNTKWKMTKNGATQTSTMLYDFDLLPEGKMRMEKWSEIRAQWRQAGNVLYLEVNDKHAQYKGEISEDGESMKGSAQNVKGAEWTWKAKRRDA